MEEIIAHEEENKMAMFTHIGAMVGSFFPPFNIVIPLLVWLNKKNESEFIDYHGKEVLNFQISMTIWYAIAGALCFVLIGFAILPILWIVSVVCSIMGGIKAKDGGNYHYPLTIRLL